MTACARKNCPNKGIWYPLLLLAHKSAPGQQATMCIDMMVCSEHKADMDLDALVTDTGWADICAGFRSAGKMAPTRGLTQLDWTKEAPDLPKLS
jgi:hypothetical protein